MDGLCDYIVEMIASFASFQFKFWPFPYPGLSLFHSSLHLPLFSPLLFLLSSSLAWLLYFYLLSLSLPLSESLSLSLSLFLFLFSSSSLPLLSRSSILRRLSAL